jgi:hypothetical protein
VTQKRDDPARWTFYLALAGSAHMALFLATRSRPSGPARAGLSVPTAQIDLELDAPADEAPAAGAPMARTDRLAAARLPVHERTMDGRETRSGHGAGPDAPPAAEPSDDTGVAPAGTAWTFDPRGPLDITAPRFVARATQEATAERAPAGVSASGGLVEGLDAHDASIGMGRGGPVLVALEAAARGTDAPFEGTATFDVAVDTSGHVSIALVDASSASAQWSKVADATRTSLDPARLRIAPGAHGWHVVAQLEAKVQYPNGLDPKSLGATAQATAGHVKERNESVDIELPRATLAVAGKVCSIRLDLGLTLTPISGGCNPENIGMRPLRVVHGHVVSEGRL